MQPHYRILVVDDNPMNIAVVEEILADDYDLRTTDSGEEALRIIPDLRPDLVLLDITMPGMDGYDVCRRLRLNPALCHIKVIMVSSRALVSERITGYDAGADDYITRPFDAEELLAKVRVFLRLKSVEEVNQLKSNFLSLLGHETRTPLNGVISPAEMLVSDEDLDPDECRELAQMILRNARRLHDLFEKVTRLSALRAGTWVPKLAPAGLCDVIHEALGEVASRAAPRGVALKARFEVNVMLALDRESLTTVIREILDNAIRFSPADGTVVVSTAGDGETVSLRITDQGQGIPADFLPRVFDEFASPDVPYQSEGHGLSLALAREVVRQHQGSITAESGPGAGTTITIRLPLTEPSSTAPQDDCGSGVTERPLASAGRQWD